MMKKICLSKSLFVLLSAMVFMGISPALAQEETSPASESESASLTQGQAAIIIARRLGLLDSDGNAPSPAVAIQLLSAHGVNPKGGWDASATMNTGDLAVVFVQALGLEGELSDAQVASDDPQPYVDLLIESYNVDVATLGNALSSESELSQGLGRLQPAPNDTIISQQDLEAALDAIVGGGNSDVSNNITPSAP